MGEGSGVGHLKLPVFRDGQIECEACGERETAGMRSCRREDCPYVRYEGRGNLRSVRPSSGATGCLKAAVVLLALFVLQTFNPEGRMVILILLGLSSAILFLMLNIDRFRHVLVLYNPSNAAQAWTVSAFLQKVQLHHESIIPVERVHIDAHPRTEGDAAVTAAMLQFPVRGKPLGHRASKGFVGAYEAVEILYAAAFAELVAVGALVAWRMSARRGRDVYFFVPGRSMATYRPGSLESEILRVVQSYRARLSTERIELPPGPDVLWIVDQLADAAGQRRGKDSMVEDLFWFAAHGIDQTVQYRSTGAWSTPVTPVQEAVHTWFSRVAVEQTRFMRYLTTGIATVIGYRDPSGA